MRYTYARSLYLTHIPQCTSTGIEYRLGLRPVLSVLLHSVPVHREISTWQWALAKINIHVNEWFSEHKFHEKEENSIPSESSLTEVANLPWIVVSRQVDRV